MRKCKDTGESMLLSLDEVGDCSPIAYLSLVVVNNAPPNSG